jgi:hypothetical protein
MQHQINNKQIDNNQNDNNQNDNNQNDNNQEPAEHPTSSDIQTIQQPNHPTPTPTLSSPCHPTYVLISAVISKLPLSNATKNSDFLISPLPSRSIALNNTNPRATVIVQHAKKWSAFPIIQYLAIHGPKVLKQQWHKQWQQ